MISLIINQPLFNPSPVGEKKYENMSFGEKNYEKIHPSATKFFDTLKSKRKPGKNDSP